MGYLYLTDQTERLVELVKLAVDTYKPGESRYAEANNRHSVKKNDTKMHQQPDTAQADDEM